MLCTQNRVQTNYKGRQFVGPAVRPGDSEHVLNERQRRGTPAEIFLTNLRAIQLDRIWRGNISV